jgi:hemoglobin
MRPFHFGRDLTPGRLPVGEPYPAGMQVDPAEPPTPRHHPAFTPEAITKLVHAFYGRVQDDDLIGPVFAQRIESWPPHLERMVMFWRSILRGESLFAPGPRGGPPVLHRAIPELESAHFDHWLKLFAATAADVFPEDAAQIVLLRAERIGIVLSSHLDPESAQRWA